VSDECRDCYADPCRCAEYAAARAGERAAASAVCASMIDAMPCRPSPWLVWPFHDAPPVLRALSQNGGDEDWILVLSPGADDPWWAHEGGPFGCCRVERHELPCGRTVLIGCHS
jgi:hypothetical protein